MITPLSIVSGSLGPGQKVFLWAVRLGYVTKINWAHDQAAVQELDSE